MLIFNPFEAVRRILDGETQHQVGVNLNVTPKPLLLLWFPLV